MRERIFKPIPQTAKMKADEIKRQRTLTRISVISLVVGVVALFAVIAGIMLKYGIIELPELFGDAFAGHDSVDYTETGDYSAMLAALSDSSETSEGGLAGNGEEGENVYVRHDVTEEECRELLYTLQPCDRYTAVYDTEVYSLDRSRAARRSIRIWKSGKKFRVEIYEGDKLISTAVCGGERITVYDSIGAENSVTYPAGDGFTAESYAGLPGLSTVIGDVFSDPDREGISISLSSDGDETLYRISYPNPSAKEQTENCYISVKYGIFVRAESIYNGECVYSLSAVSFYPELIGDETALFG